MEEKVLLNFLISLCCVVSSLSGHLHSQEGALQRAKPAHGRLREECLNEHLFMSLQDARNKIEAWRGFYNEERPHSALDW